jgi:IS1 family transposase
MIAAICEHEKFKKHGHDQLGNQRYRCLCCGVTWTDQPTKLFGDMRLEKSKAILCLRLLLEGNSIRSIERITLVNRNTMLGMLKILGERAMRYWDIKIKNLVVDNIEVDEIWGFVGCKEKNRIKLGRSRENGDAYCYTALERNTKFIVAWHLGKRSPVDAERFADKLYRVTTGRFQLSTDGYQPYKKVIPNAFNGQIDFAQLIKIYGNEGQGTAGRYSPPEIIDIHKRIVCGNPQDALICTSHVERHNLSIRMGIRRMTRLTNAFSKKWGNHESQLALYFLYYNFCRVHQTLKTTPAVAARLTDKVWSIERLLDELALQSANFRTP